jgi:hypothetical protein
MSGGTSCGSAMRKVVMVERRMGREKGVCERRITELERMRGRVKSLTTPVT